MPKGTALHIRCGRVFANVTWIVGGSALISSAWALLHLESFAPSLSQSADPWVRELYHLIFAVLLYLSAATLSGAVFGLQVVRKRERHQDLRKTSLPVWLLLSGVCASGLIMFGVVHLVATKPSASGLSREAYWIPVMVGLFGVVAATSELRRVFGAAPPKGSWLFQHVWQMCGTGVAFHTAFLVFGANRMFGFQLPGAWSLIPWVAPPVIGMSLTAIYIQRLRRARLD